MVAKGSAEAMDGGTMGMVNGRSDSPYETLLFDIDDTLYPLSTGLAAACRSNIEEFMVEKMNVPQTEVSSLCEKLYHGHGTTMAGLSARGHEFDFDEWHSFVHGRLPYQNLRPDPILRAMLLSMEQKKFCFTNADIVHANRVLQALGVQDCFDGIICFESVNTFTVAPPVVTNTTNGNSEMSKDLLPPSWSHEKRDALVTAPIASWPQRSDYPEHLSTATISPLVCKPQPEAMARAIAMAGCNPATTLYFDDSTRNILGGKKAGLRTCLVGNHIKCEGADWALDSIHNLPQAVPELWGSKSTILEGRLVSKPSVAVTVTV